MGDESKRMQNAVIEARTHDSDKMRTLSEKIRALHHDALHAPPPMTIRKCQRYIHRAHSASTLGGNRNSKTHTMPRTARRSIAGSAYERWRNAALVSEVMITV